MRSRGENMGCDVEGIFPRVRARVAILVHCSLRHPLCRLSFCIMDETPRSGGGCVHTEEKDGHPQSLRGRRSYTYRALATSDLRLLVNPPHS